MNAPVLDTLRCAQTLKTAGFTQSQADATAQVLADALADVVTKKDLDDAITGVEARLKAEMNNGFKAERAETNAGFAAHKAAMDAGFAALRAEMDARFAATQAEMDARFAAMQAEMDAGFASVRTEMDAGFASVRTEMDAGFASVRTDMNAGFAAQNAKYDKLDTKFEERSESTANQLKHLTRLVYIMLVAMLALIFESSVGPLLTWGNAPTNPPSTEAAAPTPKDQNPNPTLDSPKDPTPTTPPA